MWWWCKNTSNKRRVWSIRVLSSPLFCCSFLPLPPLPCTTFSFPFIPPSPPTPTLISPPECTSCNSESCCRWFCFGVTWGGNFESVWSSKCKLHICSLAGFWTRPALVFLPPSSVSLWGFGSVWDPPKRRRRESQKASLFQRLEKEEKRIPLARERRKKELLVFVGANFSFLFFSFIPPWRRIKKKECWFSLRFLVLRVPHRRRSLLKVVGIVV